MRAFHNHLKSAIKNDIIKLLNNPTDTAFGLIHAVLNDFGYRLARVNGSHYIYKKEYKEAESVPVHNKKVKKCHVKKLIKRLKNTSIP